MNTTTLMAREKRHRKSEASSTATTAAAIKQLREKTALNPVFIPTVFTARAWPGDDDDAQTHNQVEADGQRGAWSSSMLPPLLLLLKIIR